MKAFKPLYLILAFGVVSSCQDQSVRELPAEDDIQSVTFHLTAYQSDDFSTRSAYDTGADLFLWSEGDAVGILSQEGSQLKFPIQPEYYGQSYAKFDGRGFALLPNTTYASFYPFLPDYNLDLAAIPISYEGQKQLGDNDFSQLGLSAYAAALGTATSKSALDFSFQNIGSAHRYRLPALPGDYKRLILNASDSEWIISGTLNLQENHAENLTEISPLTTSGTMYLDLTGTSLTSTMQLRCWLMMPPADLTGQTIRLTLERADGTALTASVPGKDCPANSRRVFNALTSVYPATAETGSSEGTLSVQLLRSATSDQVSVSTEADWISIGSSTTEGTVTTYSIHVAENTGAQRSATISFTESSTGMVNSVTINQLKAGTIIGIGGWSSEEHSGTAQ